MTSAPPGSPATVAVDADDPSVVGFEEHSIAFSVEELAALARVSGHNLAAVVGPNPLGHVRLAERRTVLDIAQRSLRARNVLSGPDDDLVVADPVLGLLAIVSEAVLRAELVIDGGRTLTRRFHAVPYASVEHAVEHGVHRFTPFATVDVLARIARRAGLVQRPELSDPGIDLDYGSYAAARDAVGRGDNDAARTGLVESGVDPAAADRLVAMLAAAQTTVAVRITHRTGPTSLAGGELAWVDAGDVGLWRVPTIDQPFAGAFPPAVDGDPDALPDGLAEVEVRVAPVAAEALAAELFTFLPSDG